jgi:hypothetical protein
VVSGDGGIRPTSIVIVLVLVLEGIEYEYENENGRTTMRPLALRPNRAGW